MLLLFDIFLCFFILANINIVADRVKDVNRPL